MTTHISIMVDDGRVSCDPSPEPTPGELRALILSTHEASMSAIARLTAAIAALASAVQTEQQQIQQVVTDLRAQSDAALEPLIAQLESATSNLSNISEQLTSASATPDEVIPDAPVGDPNDTPLPDAGTGEGAEGGETLPASEEGTPRGRSRR